jgi:stalled ribosome rescue protein Dom34
MSLYHAVALVDHQSAKVFQFGEGQVTEDKVHTHLHQTRQHGSTVRSEHEFFGEVCDALEGIAEVLIAGGHTSLSDFRHYVDKHRPAIAAHIVAYDVVDQPSDAQLVALARKHFVKIDNMKGMPS